MQMILSEGCLFMTYFCGYLVVNFTFAFTHVFKLYTAYGKPISSRADTDPSIDAVTVTWITPTRHLKDKANFAIWKQMCEDAEHCVFMWWKSPSKRDKTLYCTIEKIKRRYSDSTIIFHCPSENRNVIVVQCFN